MFAALRDLNARAAAAGVLLLPGAGFDVVASDTLLARLAAVLGSTPTHGEMAFVYGTQHKLSPGASATTAAGMGDGNYELVDGEVRSVPMAHKCRTVELPRRGRVDCASLPLR